MVRRRLRRVDTLAGHGRHAGPAATMRTMTSTAHPPSARSPFGDHLRHWRQHRRLSQQGLALEAEISTRHLSYVETGRAQPSREMLLRSANGFGALAFAALNVEVRCAPGTWVEEEGEESADRWMRISADGEEEITWKTA